MAKIEIRNLCKIFGPAPQAALKLLQEGKSKQDIFEQTGHAIGLDNVSFDVAEGEILVVMGLSGSGKSTLIRCINRLFEPTSGTVTINGRDITRLDDDSLRRFRRDTFGMVFQQFALLPHRSVLANVEFGLEIQGLSADTRRDKAQQALQMVGLEGWEDAYPAQLSGGMQQRVGLARALTVEPEIMLMDEAFSALDPLIRRDMQNELLALQEKVRKTIVFVSHDLDEAVKIADRIVLMKDGAVVQAGTPEEILTSPAGAYVARFVEDVNVAKVLTAGSVLTRARPVAHPNDAVADVVRTMQEVGYASLLIVDGEGRLQGLVERAAAQDELSSHAPSLARVTKTEIPRVTPDTLLPELFRLFSTWSDAVPVVDGRDRLLGVVRKTDIMQALARDTESEDGKHTQATAG